MKILNLGSLNIDKVYSMPHFVTPGETLASEGYNEFPGGKGLNQSIAMAKAGSPVYHGGKIGKDGLMLKDVLDKSGVNTDNVITCASVTGHAVIQVSHGGENSIILFGGTNKSLSKDEIDTILNKFSKGDLLVLQNEVNLIDYIIDKAYSMGLIIAFNPSPFDSSIKKLDFSKITYLILNEIEGKEITGDAQPKMIMNKLLALSENLKIVLTLGSNGSVYADRDNVIEQECYKANAVDTTGAGDTFTGYFLSSISKGNDVKYSLKLASKAAAISVSRHGASSSIPTLEEVLSSL